MSDYKYIKFTGLTAINGQTDRTFAIYNLRHNSLATDLDVMSIKYLFANSGEDDIVFSVVKEDGTAFDKTVPADGVQYNAFCAAILDKILSLTSSNKRLHTIACGASGDIAPTLGRITQVDIG
tara:strand:+ start:132 stop:500 length:369 start_codon:yes stop_codon:yes gene_type:complete